MTPKSGWQKDDWGDWWEKFPVFFTLDDGILNQQMEWKSHQNGDWNDRHLNVSAAEFNTQKNSWTGYPLGNVYIVFFSHGPLEIADLPILQIAIFNSYVTNYHFGYV